MNIRSFIVFIMLLAFTVVMAGCGRTETYGEIGSDKAATAVKDILTNPEAYNGKAVTVEGKIATECSTGCWFDLKDDGAVIYVNIEPSGLAIPQRVGRSATIEGEIQVKDGKPSLIGKGVRIK